MCSWGLIKDSKEKDAAGAESLHSEEIRENLEGVSMDPWYYIYENYVNPVPKKKNDPWFDPMSFVFIIIWFASSTVCWARLFCTIKWCTWRVLDNQDPSQRDPIFWICPMFAKIQALQGFAIRFYGFTCHAFSNSAMHRLRTWSKMMILSTWMEFQRNILWDKNPS